LIILSRKLKAGKAKESLNYDLVDIFDVANEDFFRTDNESYETNVFYTPKSNRTKKTFVTPQEDGID
jgi:hypothetical protein